MCIYNYIQIHPCCRIYIMVWGLRGVVQAVGLSPSDVMGFLGWCGGKTVPLAEMFQNGGWLFCLGGYRYGSYIALEVAYVP